MQRGGIVSLTLLYLLTLFYVDSARQWMVIIPVDSSTVGVERGVPNKAIITEWTTPFCQSWSILDANNRSLQPFDTWHTHHPESIVTTETEDEFCVETFASNLTMFYKNQFVSNCTLIHARGMWGSGWSADFWNIQSGLIYALHNQVPLVMTKWEQNNTWIDWESEHPWNYAANKKGHSNITCKLADTTCYFLPYHGCGPINELKNMSVKLLEGRGNKKIEKSSRIWNELGWSAYNFMTRKQLWLRRSVFDYQKQFNEANSIISGSDCTAMHVRRSDVMVDKRRPYYPVAYYVDMIPEEKLEDPNHYIFLLTDDANAIDEAHEFFPNLKWKHLDRPRHRGSSGGWQSHTPSGDPALEVIILVSTFELVQKCSVLVAGISSFAEYMYAHVSNNCE